MSTNRAPRASTAAEARALALMQAAMECIKAAILEMPEEEAIRAAEDVRSGEAVVLFHVCDGKTQLMFNPPEEIKWLFR